MLAFAHTVQLFRNTFKLLRDALPLLLNFPKVRLCCFPAAEELEPAI